MNFATIILSFKGEFYEIKENFNILCVSIELLLVLMRKC